MANSASFVRVAREPFEAIWPAVDLLTRAHATEVEPPGPRRFALDVPRMIQLDRLGLIRVWTLRLDGELWGYCTWNLSWDLESEGLPIATQGAWYVKPGAPWGAAARLFGESVDGLRGFGVQCVFPHHRLQGRGRHLGRFFRAMGAVPVQQTYMLWVGAQPSEPESLIESGASNA